MKKITKLIIIFILIIICALIFNMIRNIYIINKIKNNSNKYFSDMNSYKGKIEFFSTKISDDNVTEENIDREEFYYKDGIYLIKRYSKDKLINIEWKNVNTNEQISNSSNDVQGEFIYTDIMNLDFVINEEFDNNNLKLYLLNFIKSDKNNYIITGRQTDFYFNKETGVLSKFDAKNGHYEIYSIDKNNVNDEELKKPDLTSMQIDN